MNFESMGGMNKHQQDTDDLSMPPQVVGGRRRRRSRTTKGRKGRGGYMMDVLGATALLGATQFAKGRASYGFTGRNGYYGKTKRRGSRRSRRSSRSRGRR
jgi:hypothetical protein